MHTAETINYNFGLTLRNRRPTIRAKVVVDGASHSLVGYKGRKKKKKDTRYIFRILLWFPDNCPATAFGKWGHIVRGNISESHLFLCLSNRLLKGLG